MVGPFTAEQMTARLGKLWVPSRRFGVRQSQKIRSVDDFSLYMINASVSTHEKIDLEGIDNICSVARFFMGSCEGKGSWTLPGPEAPVSGRLAQDFPRPVSGDLAGRCLNFKHAYRQLARRPCD